MTQIAELGEGNLDRLDGNLVFIGSALHSFVTVSLRGSACSHLYQATLFGQGHHLAVSHPEPVDVSPLFRHNVV